MNSPYLIDILFPMENKPKCGGKREGAGAPKKPKTKVITFRVRENEEQPVREAVKQTITKHRKL